MNLAKILAFNSIFLVSLLLVQCQSTPNPTSSETAAKTVDSTTTEPQPLQTGAERLDLYLPLLQGKTIALMVNQTSMIGEQHLVDTLLQLGVKIQHIFAPEHGFRGKADRGATIQDDKDSKTGLPIRSLYGKKKKPGAAELAGVDLVIFDIQDVGARFYTYISSMHYLMEGCAEQQVPVLILDRPNPNGHYVDGPVLEPAFASFVGMHPVPVVHGMTVGEYAQMINGEGWLGEDKNCTLEVIPCQAYTHKTLYELPIKPSPNLPNNRSIYLYPSLCFFEGTVVSVGRGTEKQFQVLGHPTARVGDFEFTPISREGASQPLHQDQLCRGLDLSLQSSDDFRKLGRLDLSYLIQFYQDYQVEDTPFFNTNNFIHKLAGTASLKTQIEAGMSEEDIRATWQEDLARFKQMRKKYLLYP